MGLVLTGSTDSVSRPRHEWQVSIVPRGISTKRCLAHVWSGNGVQVLQSSNVQRVSISALRPFRRGISMCGIPIARKSLLLRVEISIASYENITGYLTFSKDEC